MLDIQAFAGYDCLRKSSKNGRKRRSTLGKNSRMQNRIAVLLLLSMVASVRAEKPVTRGPASPPFELRDGDCVAFLGATLIERDIAHGYLEVGLTARFPNANIRFRNLGWSGDTVFGEARAGFGTPADGFRELQKQLELVKPTVIFLAYGTNEAFAGESGLPNFVQGLNSLLGVLEKHTKRIVVLPPILMEDHGPPLPNPAKANANTRLYARKLAEIAQERGYRFVDTTSKVIRGDKVYGADRMTTNGMSLTDVGYGQWAGVVLQELGLTQFSPANIHLQANGMVVRVENAELGRVDRLADGLQFHVNWTNVAPSSLAPRFNLSVKGLPPGSYRLRVDGHDFSVANAESWAKGQPVSAGKLAKPHEDLRRVILEKNTLFFHRWRPQNETYLFGFRKHEQGNNAVEIPQFDKLVAEQESIIASLRRPRVYRFELTKSP